MFGFELPSVLLARRTRKFLEKNEKFMSWGEYSKIDYTHNFIRHQRQQR